MTSSSRRRLMKALAAGGGAVAIADQWAKPVVDTVMLPAHAAITACRSFAGLVEAPEVDMCFQSASCLNIRICGETVDVAFFDDLADQWLGAGSLENDGSFVVQIQEVEGTDVVLVAGQLNEAGDAISGTVGDGDCPAQPNPYTIGPGAVCEVRGP